jgi:hypothetical protein
VTSEKEPTLFGAVFNALHGCQWLIAAGLDFDILLEVIRRGGDLPADHHLIVERARLDQLVANLTTTKSAGDKEDVKGKCKLKIACLGWGSLVWDPGSLPVRPPWHADGPLVRVEFLRKSRGNRVTLVLDDSAAAVPSQWALIETDDITTAITALRNREGISPKYEKRDIGVWMKGDPSHPLILDLLSWAQAREIDYVIWTNLARKFDGLTGPATAEQVIGYLQTLTGKARDGAAEYVQRAPRQIRTQYRERIEASLGWAPLELPPK